MPLKTSHLPVCRYKRNKLHTTAAIFLYQWTIVEKKMPQSTHYIIMKNKKNCTQKAMLFCKGKWRGKNCMHEYTELQKVHNKPFFFFYQLHHNKFKNAYSGGIVKHTLNKNFYRRFCMMSLTVFLLYFYGLFMLWWWYEEILKRLFEIF